MFLLDELAKMLMEEEKVSGEQLIKLINKAAAEGRRLFLPRDRVLKCQKHEKAQV